MIQRRFEPEIVMLVPGAEATLVAPFKYSSLLWATLIGYLMFDELPDTWTLAGAVVIVLAGLYVLHRETLLKRRLPPVTATGPSARFWSP